MPKSLRHRLLEKGWSEDEIENTMNLLYSKDKLDKHAQFQSSTHPIIYWVGLIIAIVGNFLIAVTLIPFLMILNSLQIYIILGIVGFVFGQLFNILIKDIEHVDEKHHLMAGVFIPTIALITVYVMTNVANKFNVILQNENTHSAVVLSIIYLVCFSAPYFFYKVKDMRWEKQMKAKEAV